MIVSPIFNRGNDASPESPPDPAVTAFARLTEARRIGDHHKAKAATRELRKIGWSCLAIAPQTGGGSR